MLHVVCMVCASIYRRSFQIYGRTSIYACPYPKGSSIHAHHTYTEEPSVYGVAHIYGRSFCMYMNTYKKSLSIYAHTYMEVVLYMCVHKRKSFNIFVHIYEKRFCICIHIYEKHFHICKGYSICTCANTK